MNLEHDHELSELHAQIARLIYENIWLSTENAKLKTIANELIQWIQQYDEQAIELIERARKEIQ
jgi:regulator of replication initiation timing